jgi:hypothetical protein
VARRPALDAPYQTLIADLEQAVRRVHRSGGAGRTKG